MKVILSISILISCLIIRLYANEGHFGSSSVITESGRILIFGGYSNRGFERSQDYFQTWDYSKGLSNEIYELDVNFNNSVASPWSLIEPTSKDRPNPRAFHTASYDLTTKNMYITGGVITLESDVSRDTLRWTEVYKGSVIDVEQCMENNTGVAQSRGGLHLSVLFIVISTTMSMSWFSIL